jgi:hypothetical protein
MHNDVEGEKRIQLLNEIDWRNEWDKIYKCDENKKEFNSGWKRVLNWIGNGSTSQIKRLKNKKRR